VLTKEQAELRVFESLARLAGYEIVGGSIKQSPPPAPDIECETAGGPLAVELVALDAPDTRTRLNNMHATEQAWVRALAQWPDAERERLAVQCEDVYLGLQIENSAGPRARTVLLKQVQAALLSKPSRFEGELFSFFDHPPGLMGATVHRGPRKTNGPRIIAPSAGSLQRPQVDKIEQKLTAKTYRTSAPLELFAYSTHDEVDAYLDGLRCIDASVQQHLPRSLFRRVWVFDFGREQLKYTFPP
jgi:hypothetical protein